jgi:hypothetical protein
MEFTWGMVIMQRGQDILTIKYMERAQYNYSYGSLATLSYIGIVFLRF